MKKTLMALALTLVAGSMIACGDTPPPANNANMAKPAATNTAKPADPMPAANSNAMPAANANKPMAANTNK